MDDLSVLEETVNDVRLFDDNSSKSDQTPAPMRKPATSFHELIWYRSFRGGATYWAKEVDDLEIDTKTRHSSLKFSQILVKQSWKKFIFVK